MRQPVRDFVTVAVFAAPIVLITATVVALGVSPALVAILVLALAVLVVATIAITPRVATAWDDSRVHPWITTQAIKLLKDHNYASYREIMYISENPPGEEGTLAGIGTSIGLVGTSEMGGNMPAIHGSIVEDTPATNGQYHFYNPKAQIRDASGERGLGLNSGWALPDAQSTLGGVTKLIYNVVAPKSWEYPTTPYSAVDRASQDGVGLDDDNSHHTWRWAEDFYRRGDWVRSYTVLGRVCHLLEDMAVPAHTRNDNHLGQYAANFIDNPFEYANGLVFGGTRMEGMFPQATYDVLQKGMEPFESYTYGLVLRNEAPSTSERPIMQANWLTFFRTLAMRTHTSWYSENTIPGNDTIPGRSVDESDIPDMSRCTAIDQMPGTIAQDPTTGDRIKDAIKTVAPFAKGPVLGIGAAAVRYGWNKGTLRDRFKNVLNGDDYRSPKGVGRPYTLSPSNHMACARDVMPIAIRYAAGLIQHFYEGRERLKVELERGEKAEPWGTPVEFELSVENKGAVLEDLEVRLGGMDGIAFPEADRPDWTVELALAEDQEEPHSSARIAVVDARRHIWKVTYPQTGANRVQGGEDGQEFTPEPLKLVVRAWPPGVRPAAGGGAQW